MKYLLVSILLIGASAKLNAGPKEPGNLHRQLAEVPKCHGTCPDQDSCNNFVSNQLESCNTGCISQDLIDICDQACGDVVTSTDQSVLQLIEYGLSDRLCGQCDFYECCLSDATVGNPTKYDTCAANAPSTQAPLDGVDGSALGQLVDDVSATLDETLAGFGENIDNGTSILDGVTTALNETLTGLGENLENITNALDGALSNLGENLDKLDFGNIDTMNVSDILGVFDGIDVPGFDFSMDDFPMVATADCISILEGGGGANLEDSCSKKCVAFSSCEGVCGGEVTDMACDACNFFVCCNEGRQFEECQSLLTSDIQGVSNTSPTRSPTDASEPGEPTEGPGIEFSEGNAPESGAPYLQITMMCITLASAFLTIISI